MIAASGFVESKLYQGSCMFERTSPLSASESKSLEFHGCGGGASIKPLLILPPYSSTPQSPGFGLQNRRPIVEMRVFLRRAKSNTLEPGDMSVVVRLLKSLVRKIDVYFSRAH